MILPTFTAHIVNDANEVPIRVFKDGGCQTTFICDALAAALDLPIVKENVPLVIHGFNSSRKINTKIVRLKLKLGTQIFSHDVICVTNIRTTFRVEGIGKIISDFEQKGFQMADAAYTDSTSGYVDNIDLVLGTDSDHMLPMAYRTFGDISNPDGMACFIETPIGVVLSGNMQKMIRNLPFLSKNDSETNANFASNKYPHILPDQKFRQTFSLTNVDSSPSEIETQSYSCSNSYLLSENDEISFSPNISDLNVDESDEALSGKCQNLLNICDEKNDAVETDTNVQLIDFVLSNTKYEDDGRLIMPLLWNNKNSHLLSKNYKLATKLLQSNLDRLKRDPVKLKMYDDVIREQEELGIIERVNGLDNFLFEHPEQVFYVTWEFSVCPMTLLNAESFFYQTCTKNSTMA